MTTTVDEWLSPPTRDEAELIARLLRENSGAVAPAYESLPQQLRQILDQRNTARDDARCSRDSLERLAVHLAAAHARQADDRHHAEHLRQQLRDLAVRHGLAVTGTPAAILTRLDEALTSHTAAHYALVPAGALLGDVLTDEHGPCPVVRDPRRLPITDALHGRDSLQLPDWAHGDAPALVTVEPLGEITAHDDRPADHADPGQPLRAEHGWRITGWCPLAQVLGPQGRELIELARTWAGLLADDPTGVLETYTSQADALALSSDTAESPLLHAASAAEAALRAAGCDVDFYRQTLPIGQGWEITAVAARDLIGTTPSWDDDAYRVLTQPWRHAVSAAHPADEPLPAH